MIDLLESKMYESVPHINLVMVYFSTLIEILFLFICC